MKTWKERAVDWGSVSALLTAFFMAPIPMTTGNVTGARWIYNIPQDIKAETRRVDLAAIERDANIRKDMRRQYLAAVDRNVSILEESRKETALLTLQMQYNFLLGEKRNIQTGSYYTEDQKSIELDKLNRKIDELYDRTIRRGIKVDDIQSRNNRMMVASKE